MPTQDKAQEEKQKIWNELDAADANGDAPAPAPAATDAPAPAPADEATAPAAQATGEEAPAPAADDPYAGLPQVLKDEILGMKQMLASQAQQLRGANGHIGGLTSQLKELKAAREATRATGGDAPSADQLRKAQGSEGAMAKLKEDYPEFGAALDAALDERLAKVTAPAAAPDGAKVFTREEFNDFRVESRHPGWKETVAEPAFRGWLEGQSREVKALGASEDPQDAIRLLDLHKQARTQTPQQQKETQRLQAAASIPNGRAPSGIRTKPIEEMTKAEYWAYLDQQDAAAAKRG